MRRQALQVGEPGFYSWSGEPFKTQAKPETENITGEHCVHV